MTLQQVLIDTPYGPARCIRAAAPAPDKPSALLVHGSGGCADVWQTMFEWFEHVNPIAIDLPGHAGSTGTQLQSVADCAAFVDAVRIGLGLARVLVVGQSLGGAIAQQYGLTYAQHCLGIVVANSAPDFHVSEARLRAIEVDWNETAAGYAAGQVSPGANSALLAAARRMVEQRVPNVFARDLMVCNGFNSRPWAADLRTPVLILAGRHDALTALPRSLALLELIPHAELVVLSPCGHCTMLEQPVRFAAHIDLFAVQVAADKPAC